MQQEDKSFEGLIISLIIHVVLVLAYLFMPKPPIDEQPRPVEITIVEPKKTQTFVTDTKIPQADLIKELRDKAKFLSKETRRVKKEIKSKHTGKTQNDLLALPTPTLSEPQTTGGGGKPGEEVHSSLKGLVPKPKQVGTNGVGQEGFGKNIVMGASSLAEHIPGISEGAFTALNTDQFTYYTFFSRVNEQVRYRWITYVRNYLDSLSEPVLSQMARTPKSFQIEIVLNSEGHYLKSFIHHTSGESSLDMTAVDAFQNAAPFLNPPKGLVEDDNLIHLHYNFLIEFKPRGSM